MNRRSGAAVWGLVLVVAAAAAGCRRANDTGNMIELQRLRSGTLEIVLLSRRDALRHGEDAFVIEFRSTPGGKVVDVGDVRASANMPMPGMPGFGDIDVKRTDVAGRYEANSDFEMEGTWRMTIQWKGPAGQGSVTFPATVQ